VQLKLEGHELNWWKSHTETLRLEGELLVAKWEDFKTLIKLLFYPVGYMEDQLIRWHYIRQRLGQSVKEYIAKLGKMFVMLGISPRNLDVHLKYLVDEAWV